jgi:hypothetical protein
MTPTLELLIIAPFVFLLIVRVLRWQQARNDGIPAYDDPYAYPDDDGIDMPPLVLICPHDDGIDLPPPLAYPLDLATLPAPPLLLAVVRPADDEQNPAPPLDLATLPLYPYPDEESTR